NFMRMFDSVLTIGPQHKNYKGGIGAVLATYAANTDNFNFISTYNENHGRFKNLVLFFTSLLNISLKLILDRQIKIVHIHGASKGSFYRKYCVYILCKHLFRRKIIYHIHGGGYQRFYENSPRIISSLIKNLIKNADCVICLSQQWFSYYKNTFNAR